MLKKCMPKRIFQHARRGKIVVGKTIIDFARTKLLFVRTKLLFVRTKTQIIRTISEFV